MFGRRTAKRKSTKRPTHRVSASGEALERRDYVTEGVLGAALVGSATAGSLLAEPLAEEDLGYIAPLPTEGEPQNADGDVDVDPATSLGSYSVTTAAIEHAPATYEIETLDVESHNEAFTGNDSFSMDLVEELWLDPLSVEEPTPQPEPEPTSAQSSDAGDLAAVPPH